MRYIYKEEHIIEIWRKRKNVEWIYRVKNFYKYSTQ